MVFGRSLVLALFDLIDCKESKEKSNRTNYFILLIVGIEF